MALENFVVAFKIFINQQPIDDLIVHQLRGGPL